MYINNVFKNIFLHINIHIFIHSVLATYLHKGDTIISLLLKYREIRYISQDHASNKCT